MQCIIANVISRRTRRIREYDGECDRVFRVSRGFVAIRLPFQRAGERGKGGGGERARRTEERRKSGGFLLAEGKRRRLPKIYLVAPFSTATVGGGRKGGHTGRGYKISRNSWYISGGKLQIVRDLTRAASGGGNVTERHVKASGRNEKHSS